MGFVPIGFTVFYIFASTFMAGLSYGGSLMSSYYVSMNPRWINLHWKRIIGR